MILLKYWFQFQYQCSMLFNTVQYSSIRFNINVIVISRFVLINSTGLRKERWKGCTHHPHSGLGWEAAGSSEFNHWAARIVCSPHSQLLVYIACIFMEPEALQFGFHTTSSIFGNLHGTLLQRWSLKLCWIVFSKHLSVGYLASCSFW